MIRRGSQRRQGLALAITLIILSVVVVLGFGLVTLSLQNLATADANRYSKAALFCAEGGVNRAIAQIKNNNTASFTYVPSNSLVTSANVTVVPGSSSLMVNGVSVSVPPGAYYVLSRGTSKDGQFTRQVGVMLRQEPGGSLFPYAAFGNISVNINGTGATSKTDSFDSRVPGYTSYAAATKGSKGHVGTNSVASGAVSISGTPTIKGNLEVGAGGDPATVISGGGATITGTKSAMSAPMALPPVEVPTLPTAPAAAGDLAPDKYYTGALTLTGGSGNKITLHAGTYVFDSITTLGSADRIVVADGPVTVYIKGDASGKYFDMGGTSKINNNTAKSENLIFKIAGASPGSSATVNLRGGAAGYYAVYAPKHHIDIGGTADIMGAVVGQSVTAHGTPGIHYDEALAEIEGGSGKLAIKSWQRI